MTHPTPNVRWPAEWEPHDAIWLSWPHNQETWPGHYEPVPEAFAAFARQIAQTTPVRMLASHDVAKQAERELSGVNNIELIDIPTNDCWIRDYGPTFVIEENGQVAGVDWHYNSWGGKYPPWEDDAKAASRILNHLGLACHKSILCLEGGALETDGAGRLMLTPDCVITPTRNPTISREQAEAELSAKLGIQEFIWLTGGGLVGDDTDGHIDQLARFIDPQNIVIASCDHADANYNALSENRKQLKQWAAENGNGVQIHTVPIPRARYVEGQRVPECYCNFLITGNQVIVPTFADSNADQRAISILRELMQHHEVVPLDASALSWGLGAFHCMSQQQPAPRKAW